MMRVAERMNFCSSGWKQWKPRDAEHCQVGDGGCCSKLARLTVEAVRNVTRRPQKFEKVYPDLGKDPLAARGDPMCCAGILVG